MTPLVTSIAERAITVGDVLIGSGVVIGLIVIVGVIYVIGSIIMSGWSH